MSTPIIFESSEDHLFGAWRQVGVAVWRKRTSPEGVASIHRHLRSHFGSSDTPLALLTIIEEGAAPPNAEARRGMATLMQDAPKSVSCSAVVIEGEGFRAAVVRSVVTGLVLLAKQPFPHRVLSLKGALKLYDNHLGPANFVAPDFFQAIQTLRLG